MPSVSRSRTMNRSLSRRSWRKAFSMFLGTLQKRFSFPCHSASTQHILKSLTSFPHFPHFPQLTYSSLLSLADVQTCSAGDIFGELALLYNCPRAARNSVAPCAHSGAHGSHMVAAFRISIEWRIPAMVMIHPRPR